MFRREGKRETVLVFDIVAGVGMWAVSAFVFLLWCGRDCTGGSAYPCLALAFGPQVTHTLPPFDSVILKLTDTCYDLQPDQSGRAPTPSMLFFQCGEHTERHDVKLSAHP